MTAPADGVLVSRWWCLHDGCPAHGGPGDPAEVDRDARRHTEKPPKHATATACRPVHVPRRRP